MEKAFEKLLKKLLLKKYPIYLDVHVGEYGKYNPNKKICYEVHLFVFLKDCFGGILIITFLMY